MLVEPDVPLSAPCRQFLSHHSQSQLILLDTNGQTWTFPSVSSQSSVETTHKHKNS